MKIGYRTPSLKKSFAAKTSIKRQVVHRAGLKMPKGYGALRDPKKAVYNKVYNKTTVKNPIMGLATSSTSKKTSSTKANSTTNKNPTHSTTISSNKTSSTFSVKKFFRSLLTILLFLLTYFLLLMFCAVSFPNSPLFFGIAMIVYPIIFISYRVRNNKKVQRNKTTN